MSGSITYQKDRRRWMVTWYCQLTKKYIHIYRYTPTWDFLESEAMARKQLSLMQREWEMHLQGEYTFRPEKYTKRGAADVATLFDDWMKEKVRPRRSPATIKGYQSYFDNWIGPYFKENPLALHEIQYNSILKFMNFIARSPKTKLNIIMCLYELLKYAKLSGYIQAMPDFPSKEDYNLIEKPIEWIPYDVQLRVIDAIPEHHRPIFKFMMLHYRREGEACALYKTDYDVVNQAFTIRRGISARKVIEQTKTKKIHVIPCDEEFVPVILKLLNQNLTSPFMFVNPIARLKGQRYTQESLGILWKHACEKVGVDIRLYAGVKHSSCTNFIDSGGTVDELQMMTDHTRRESVLKYADVTLRRRKQMFRKRAHLQDTFKPDLKVAK